jgi:hypothetical protein
VRVPQLVNYLPVFYLNSKCSDVPDNRCGVGDRYSSSREERGFPLRSSSGLDLKPRLRPEKKSDVLSPEQTCLVISLSQPGSSSLA